MTQNRRGRFSRAFALTIVGGIAVVAFLFVLRSTERPAQNTNPAAAAVPKADLAKDLDSVRSELEARRRALDIRPVRVQRSTASKDSSRNQADTDTDAFEIGAADYIAELRAEGETEGIAAFPPPGTRPPESGVLVPDDYELPEGFARHYQSTDDGRQLPAVLTLAPDYELLDGDGNPIALGQDRIVPPEAAPPDLPIDILDVPPVQARGQAIR